MGLDSIMIPRLDGLGLIEATGYYRFFSHGGTIPRLDGLGLIEAS